MNISFQFITMIDYNNNHKNIHKIEYYKKQTIICINNVVYEKMKKGNSNKFSQPFLWKILEEINLIISK